MGYFRVFDSLVGFALGLNAKWVKDNMGYKPFTRQRLDLKEFLIELRKSFLIITEGTANMQNKTSRKKCCSLTDLLYFDGISKRPNRTIHCCDFRHVNFE